MANGSERCPTCDSNRRSARISPWCKWEDEGGEHDPWHDSPAEPTRLQHANGTLIATGANEPAEPAAGLPESMERLCREVSNGYSGVLAEELRAAIRRALDEARREAFRETHDKFLSLMMGVRGVPVDIAEWLEARAKQ